MRLVATQPPWAVGFADEVWWSRLAQPDQHRWVETGGLTRLHELARPKDETTPKALACYGLLVRRASTPDEQMLLRFVEGRPVSAVTTDFLCWCSERLGQQGVRALVLIWDNASWHKSQAVRTWLRHHNRGVKATGQGTRIVACRLPIKSPWLNPIEPKWVHGKRAVSESDRLLSADELESRVYAYYRCDRQGHLVMPQKVA
jgi:DDE superfamily endonuclease